MKKYSSFFLSFALLFTFVSCKSKTAPTKSPEQVVENALVALRENDQTMITECFGMNILDPEVLPPSFSNIYMAAFQKLEYNIISSSTDGNTATITAELTVVNLEAIAEAYLTEMENETGQETSQNLGEAVQGYIQLIQREDAEMYIATVSFMLEKVDGVWLIAYDEHMANVLFGFPSNVSA